MKFNIYNFENEPTEVELKTFDSSNTRIVDFADGDYILRGAQIGEWMEYVPPEDGVISYKRMIAFR